ncbi:chemotaxis protein CheW [Evansella sp. AB-rgal1]|uniref:chemotaxis protein CheW n=1 Tax=Evansella sp. AB-rgal1 TaxID=3242696 RepID=UPI00359E5DCC
MEKNQYLDMFIEESKEHLLSMNKNLLEMEKNPSDPLLISEIFRSAHTLKGMAATMGYEDLANITHQMENVLDGIRNNSIVVSSDLLDVVFESVDVLEEIVMDISSGGEGKRDVVTIVKKLEKIEQGTTISETSATLEIASTDSMLDQQFDNFERTVLIQSKEQGFHAFQAHIHLREDCILKAARVYMVFDVLEQVGEVIKSSPTVDQLEEENFDLDFTITLLTKDSVEDVKAKIFKVSEIDHVSISEINVEEFQSSEELQETEQVEKSEIVENETISKELTDSSKATEGTRGSTSPSNKTIRVNIDRLDRLMNLFEELVIDRGRLEQISQDAKNEELSETVEHMSRISGDLQNIILTMRMVPVEQVFNRFPRMIRGLAKDLNKKISLNIVGAETELDRTVIDEIGDPLVHLLRNSMDHGIEHPSNRASKGKPEEGTITLKAYHSGNHVFIEVSDDGAGIDRNRVTERAVKNGIITVDKSSTMQDKEVYELLFSSGFSTAEKISDVSGRGVGLDVVKNKIESLGGNVFVDSVPGKGTTFSIQLPLTLSIISVMLVEIQSETYAIPLSSIIETAIIKDEDILVVHNQKVIDFRGKVVPLIDLTSFFDVPKSKENNGYQSIVIVRKGDKIAGLVVNSFIGQKEIVLKSLGNYLSSVFAISGATILGNGQVALILDCNSLIK